MKSSKRIIWIDDKAERKRTADDLNAEFRNIKDENVAEVVSRIFAGPQPYLVILDHILDQTLTNNPLLRRGSTIAEAIKEKWPACPVLGVTAADNVDDINLRTKQAYDALLPFTDFGRYFDRITRIGGEFARVTRTKPKSSRGLIKLLKPPPGEAERLLAALPDDLKSSPGGLSTPSRLYRWVNEILERPGFLYDRLWSATFLGLTTEGFKIVESRFTSAEYAGIFANREEPRWWLNGLSVVLYKHVKPKPGEMSWHLGRRLGSLTKRQYSRCYVCGEEYPEIVAYLDKSSEEQQPMHLKCTKLHPSYKRELYFEDIRIMHCQ